MASRPSPPKPHELRGARVPEFERARIATETPGSPSSATTLSSSSMIGPPALPPRPITGISGYGGGGGYGGVSPYGAMGGYGAGLSRYGGSSLYGSSYGAGYGASRFGYGASRYGSYGGSYGSGYGGSYGSGYGGGYGGYGGGGYGGGYNRGALGPLGQRGPGEGGPAVVTWIDQFAQVVDTFGRFAHLLDMNCDALYGSFSSVLRLFESMSELRRELLFIFQTVTLYRLLRAALNRFGVGELITGGSTSTNSEGLNLESFQQFQGKTQPAQPKGRRVWPFLLFLVSAIGGPLLINRLWRMLRSSSTSQPQLTREEEELWQSGPVYVQALYDFPGSGSEGDLTFTKGTIIKVLRADPNQGWWEGESAGRVGLFPSNFVETVPQQATTATTNSWASSSSEQPIRLHLGDHARPPSHFA